MKLYKILSISIFLTLALTIVTSIAHTEADPYETDLIAGQFYDAGEVLVWNDGDNLYVKFVAAEDWQMETTHLHVAESWEDIPQKNGNPPPGQFDYKDDHDPPVTEFLYEIENTWDVDDELAIAAHADICQETIEGGIEDVEEELPDTVTVSAVHATTIGHLTSYFLVTVSGGTSLDGSYDGWCIDLDSNMVDYHSFTANVYSTYGAIPMGIIEQPENLDLLNWIINQNFVGQASPGEYGIYTYGDVQRAIWELVEDQQSGTSYLGPWSQNRADEIVAEAEGEGEGFIPDCGEILAVILKPIDPDDGQICIIGIPIPCESEWECETAWGDGADFPGRNWAMYFTYTIQ